MRKIFLLLIFIAFVLIFFFIAFSSKKVDAPAEKPVLTDLRNIEKKKCGLENCHGLDFSCGENIPEVCSEEYQIGDSCRRYAECRIFQGVCQKIESEKFDNCKECVEKCKEDFSGKEAELFDCDGNCNLKINETENPELF